MWELEMIPEPKTKRLDRTVRKPVAEDSPEALARELANYATLLEQQRRDNRQRTEVASRRKPGLATK